MSGQRAFKAVPGLLGAASTLLTDHLSLRPGETVLITFDSGSDPRLAGALFDAAAAAGGLPLKVQHARLPFQGKLADPYVPEALVAMARGSDLWLDCNFPYHAGSDGHHRAIAGERTRYLLLGDLDADGVERLYGFGHLDELFEIQQRFDSLFERSAGSRCRVTSANGTDVSFRIAKAAQRKLRNLERSGASTPLGSSMVYPVPESVKGLVVLDAIFHEFYATPTQPIRLHLDGAISRVEHAPGHGAVTDRALRRASGGEYGGVIHFSCGFHPVARYAGRSFIEDIRTIGASAIGLGTPWWEPGGGENHPDGIVVQQSLWIDDVAIVRDGTIVAPELLEAAQNLAMLLT